MWAFVIVAYLYLKKMWLSRNNFLILFNLLILQFNMCAFNCVNFLNGDRRMFSVLIFLKVGELVEFTPLYCGKWGIFSDNPVIWRTAQLI